MGSRAYDRLVAQLQAPARPLRTPRRDPRGIHENRLLHHLLATASKLFLLELLSAFEIASLVLHLTLQARKVRPNSLCSANLSLHFSVGRRLSPDDYVWEVMDATMRWSQADPNRQAFRARRFRFGDYSQVQMSE